MTIAVAIKRAVAATERGERRARTIADQPPTDAEKNCTHCQTTVDLRLSWRTESRNTKRRSAPSCNRVARRRYRDGGRHHKCEARIEIAKNIEEADDLRRVDHLRDSEPEAEK